MTTLPGVAVPLGGKTSLRKFQHHVRTVKTGITFIRNTSIGGKYYNVSVKVVGSECVRPTPDLPKHLRLESQKSPTVGQLLTGEIGLNAFTPSGILSCPTVHSQFDSDYLDVSASLNPDQPNQEGQKSPNVEQYEGEGLSIKGWDGITVRLIIPVALSGLLPTLCNSTQLFTDIQLNPSDVEGAIVLLILIILAAWMLVQGMQGVNHLAPNPMRDSMMHVATDNQLQRLLCGIGLMTLITGAHAGGDMEIRNAKVENVWENGDYAKAAVSVAVGLMTIGGGVAVWKRCNRRAAAGIDDALAGIRYVRSNPDLVIPARL